MVLIDIQTSCWPNLNLIKGVVPEIFHDFVMLWRFYAKHFYCQHTVDCNKTGNNDKKCVLLYILAVTDSFSITFLTPNIINKLNALAWPLCLKLYYLDL